MVLSLLDLCIATVISHKLDYTNLPQDLIRLFRSREDIVNFCREQVVFWDRRYHPGKAPLVRSYSPCDYRGKNMVKEIYAALCNHSLGKIHIHWGNRESNTDIIFVNTPHLFRIDVIGWRNTPDILSKIAIVSSRFGSMIETTTTNRLLTDGVSSNRITYNKDMFTNRLVIYDLDMEDVRADHEFLSKFCGVFVVWKNTIDCVITPKAEYRVIVFSHHADHQVIETLKNLFPVDAIVNYNGNYYSNLDDTLHLYAWRIQYRYSKYTNKWLL